MIISDSVTEKNKLVLYLYVFYTAYVVFQPILLTTIGFSSTIIDEIVVASLMFYSCLHNYVYKSTELKVIICILIIFLFYSIELGVNVPAAAIQDFLIFLKPFYSFFIPFLVPIVISTRTALILKRLYVIYGIVLWGLLPILYSFGIDTKMYYPMCIITAISYLLFSENSKRDYILALLMLSPALIEMVIQSGHAVRAKFVAQYLMYIWIVFYVDDKITLKLKWILSFGSVCVLAIYFGWEKFSHVFINTEDEAARTLFNIYAVEVLREYFPFGPGFGTYGSEAAAKYYSPLYYDFHFDAYYGLSPDSYKSDHNYLCDTFFPILTQFGVVGPIFFIWFWLRRWKDSMNLFLEQYKLYLFIFVVMIIQCTGVNSFTGPIGVPYMMFVGMVLSYDKYE